MSDTPAATARHWGVGSVLWLTALAIMAGFQLWRGAWVDGLLFSVLVAVLVIDRLAGGRLRMPALPAAPRRMFLAISAALGLILVFAPRQGWLDSHGPGRADGVSAHSSPCPSRSSRSSPRWHRSRRADATTKS
ncbi:MAG: hypothetical protein ACSLE3_07675 [Microbacteriaceae bacterium]